MREKIHAYEEKNNSYSLLYYYFWASAVFSVLFCIAIITRDIIILGKDPSILSSSSKSVYITMIFTLSVILLILFGCCLLLRPYTCLLLCLFTCKCWKRVNLVYACARWQLIYKAKEAVRRANLPEEQGPEQQVDQDLSELVKELKDQLSKASEDMNQELIQKIAKKLRNRAKEVQRQARQQVTWYEIVAILFLWISMQLLGYHMYYIVLAMMATPVQSVSFVLMYIFSIVFIVTTIALILKICSIIVDKSIDCIFKSENCTCLKSFPCTCVINIVLTVVAIFLISFAIFIATLIMFIIGYLALLSNGHHRGMAESVILGFIPSAIIFSLDILMKKILEKVDKHQNPS